jgi:hypothetical protein
MHTRGDTMRLVLLVFGLSACNMDFGVSGLTDAGNAALDTAADDAGPDGVAGTDRRGPQGDTDDTDAPPPRCHGPS